MKALISYQFYKKSTEGITIVLLGEVISYPNNINENEIRSIKANLRSLENIHDTNIHVNIVSISYIK